MPRLLQIPAGEDLLPALAALEPGAWLQGNGHVENVEIRIAGEVTDPTRALRGRFTLVSLIGPGGGPFTATLARATDLGLEQVGGVLTRARSQGVTLVVFSPEQPAQAPRREVVAVAPRSTPPRPSPEVPERGAELGATSPRPSPRQDGAERGADGATSPPRPSPRQDGAERGAELGATAASPPASPPPSPVPPRTWAEVAAASEEAEDEGEPYPVAGDLVDHLSFGLCEVLKSDGDRLHLRDIKGAGRIREVALVALKVMPPTRQNGKRLFRLMRK